MSPAWPTRDHVIPCILFEAGYRQLHRILARERVNLARAVALGSLIAQPVKEGVDAAARAERILAPHVAEAWPSPQTG